MSNQTEVIKDEIAAKWEAEGRTLAHTVAMHGVTATDIILDHTLVRALVGENKQLKARVQTLERQVAGLLQRLA